MMRVMPSGYSNFKILISGLGSIGQRHIKNLHSLGVTKLAFADPKPDPESVQKLKEEINIEEFSDFEEALSSFKPDIVFICTPTALHIPQALLAAKAGAHLFVEKPLAFKLEGVDELEKVIQEKGLITMCACDMRFIPGVKKVQELISDGSIGDVISARIRSGSYLPRWRRKVPYRESYSANPESGGVTLDCIHEIDLALWFLGDAEVLHGSTVAAKSIGIEPDGLTEILLKHSSGTLCNIHLNFIQHNWRRSCEFIGTEGVIEWELHIAPGLEIPAGLEPRLELFGNDGKRKESFKDLAELTHNQPYLDEVEHFMQSVSSHTPSCAPLSSGKRALEIALAVRNNFVW